MNGWLSVAIIVVAQITVTVFLIRAAARRWWDYLVISVLTVALLRPTAQHVSGDVSRYLPDAIWSDGSESKEQIIYSSAASTILLPLIVSAFAVYIFKQVRRALQTATQRQLGHAAWHEATDGQPEIAAYWPYHGSADPVRLGDHGFVGHIDPFAIEPHAIVSVAGLPTSLTAVPSASEQHGPFPLFKPSNHAFSSGVALAYWPRSRACPRWEPSPSSISAKPIVSGVFKRLAHRPCEFSGPLFSRSSSVYKRGALPPESIQSLTCRLLQHPPARAANAKHFACQLFGLLCPLHFSVVQHGLIPADLR